MPAMMDDGLAIAIAAGEIGAVTFDTCIFDQHGANLQSRALRNLDQFKGTPIALILPDAIGIEIRTHIEGNAESAAIQLRRAVTAYLRTWAFQEGTCGLTADIDLSRDPAIFALSQWDNFVRELAIEVIAPEGLVSVTQLMDSYAAVAPPFANKKDKKHEFPDAVALLTLEGWGAAHNTSVLAISTDGGWKAFAANSPRVVCVDDLAKALDHFNRADRFIANRVVTKLRENAAAGVEGEIEHEFERYLDDPNIEIEADISFCFDSELTGAILQHWEVVDGPFVVRSDSDEIAFTLKLDCIINFEASFELYVYDGTDKDWVRVGHTSGDVDKSFLIEVTITCSKTVDPEPEVINAEITGTHFHVDFGYVDPYRNSDEE